MELDRRTGQSETPNNQYTPEYQPKKRLVDYTTHHLPMPSTEQEPRHFKPEIPREQTTPIIELQKLREEIVSLRESNHQLEDLVKVTILRSTTAPQLGAPASQTTMYHPQSPGSAPGPMFIPSPTSTSGPSSMHTALPNINSTTQLPSLTRPFAENTSTPVTSTSFLLPEPPDSLYSRMSLSHLTDGPTNTNPDLQNKNRTQQQSSLPILPPQDCNLPQEIFPYTPTNIATPSRQLNCWYRFSSPPGTLIPTSCWLIRKTGRADDWRLLECNESFLQLLKTSPNDMQGIAFLDLVPPKFKSTTCETLQHIIRVSTSFQII
jgi:hypothetical protein